MKCSLKKRIYFFLQNMIWLRGYKEVRPDSWFGQSLLVPVSENSFTFFFCQCEHLAKIKIADWDEDFEKIMTKHRLTWRLKGVRAGLVESGEGKERKGVRASAAMIFPSVAKDLGVISNPLTLTRGRVNGWDFALGCSSTFLPSAAPETRNKMRLSWPHTPALG